MIGKPSRFSAVSRRETALRVVGAVNCLLLSSVGMFPVFAANHKSTALESDRSVGVNFPALLSQATDENSIVSFRTRGYAVRVYRDGDRTLMNVFDRTNSITRLNRGPTSDTVLAGNPTYISTGSYSGNTATYQVMVRGEGDLQLRIMQGDGGLIAEENAEVITVFEVPRERLEAQGETTLNFETDAYSVRVFERDDQSFMNVYNTFSGITEVNGAAANIAPNEPPYEQAISYVSSGARSDRPVQYFARLLSTGEAILEVYNVNNQRIFQESAVGPVTYDLGNLPPGIIVPNELPAAAASQGDYVAAVFGGDGTLDEVMQLYPDARMEDTRLGPFVNAGNFNNEDSAAARVLELRGLGFNARVIYRDTDYR
ncbi:MAG: hypothetical protein AAGC93_31250 [Cyanobacteria bacterium P01_F01_bin.53]